MDGTRNISGGLRVTVIGAIANIALSIIKFTAGVSGNSSALVADAIHSLSDLATDGVAYVALKISNQKPDAEHPYGHGRAETIGSAIIGSAVFFVGIGLAWKIFSNVLSNETKIPEVIALYGASLSIVVKEALYHYTKYEGEKIRSEMIIANAWHHRSDAISSVAALIGIAGAVMGYPLLDSLAAIIVGVMVAGVGGHILLESIDNLMDKGVSQEKMTDMVNIIGKNAQVIDFHELKTRKLGQDTFVDVHIQVAPKISVSEAHNIAESIRRELRQKIEDVTDALVHIDAEEDLDGRFYQISRSDVEVELKKIINELSLISLDGDIVFHFLLHQVCADVTIEFDESVLPEEEKELAGVLAKKIIEGSAVTEVNIRHSLISKSANKNKGDSNEV